MPVVYALVLLTGWVLFTATPLSASPVQVFECEVVSQHDLVPQGALDSRFILRRHVIKKPPDSEFINTDWSLGRFTDNGSFEVEVFPTGQPGITEHSTSIRSAILDGRNSVRDEILDEALSTTETITVDGYKLEAFSMILSKQDGTAFDSHLDYPESFDLSEYNQKECTVNWRAPAALPCPGSPGIVCDTGLHKGLITSVSTEPHAEDHGDGVSINAGMNDAWVNPLAEFQGLIVNVFPVFKLVFVAWFTFDSEPPPIETVAFFGAADQRWVSGAGTYAGNRVELKMESTFGGRFNSSDPQAMQDTEYGTMILEFDSCSSGTVSYEFPAAGESGEFNIVRVLEDNVALCEALAE